MLAAFLGVLMRWIHVTSTVALLGGVLYARYIVQPSMKALTTEGMSNLAQQTSVRFRSWIVGAMAALLGSGIYNLLTKPFVPRGYHMWFGIKMLLVLHIFAVLFLLAKTPAISPEQQAKRSRWMSGIVVSGLVVLLISAYLRWISIKI